MKLDVALAVAQGVLAEGQTRHFAPLTVAVLDAGGHTVVLLRSDGSSLLRSQIATGKAYGVLGLGFGGRELAARAAKMPAFFDALIELSDGRMVPVPGGVLVRSADGALLGAVGVSGDTSDNDEICALAAIEATGLVADAG
ncbi:heme-binding protein [Massilia sp. METH4]|uniref:GlcG/HbpS family heme-binding protein n=1 Tax=Massilia sp. METH4 TaxID=3123041 RepID=UPI0030D3DDC6